jgi:hypothetical protein
MSPGDDNGQADPSPALWWNDHLTLAQAKTAPTAQPEDTTPWQAIEEDGLFGI